MTPRESPGSQWGKLSREKHKTEGGEEREREREREREINDNIPREGGSC